MKIDLVHVGMKKINVAKRFLKMWKKKGIGDALACFGIWKKDGQFVNEHNPNWLALTTTPAYSIEMRTGVKFTFIKNFVCGLHGAGIRKHWIAFEVWWFNKLLIDFKKYI